MEAGCWAVRSTSPTLAKIKRNRQRFLAFLPKNSSIRNMPKRTQNRDAWHRFGRWAWHQFTARLGPGSPRRPAPVRREARPRFTSRDQAPVHRASRRRFAATPGAGSPRNPPPARQHRSAPIAQTDRKRRSASGRSAPRWLINAIQPPSSTNTDRFFDERDPDSVARSRKAGSTKDNDRGVPTRRRAGLRPCRSRRGGSRRCVAASARGWRRARRGMWSSPSPGPKPRGRDGPARREKPAPGDS